jgi:hypothetical protein
MTQPYDLRNTQYGGAFAIQDSATVAVLQQPMDLGCLHNDSVIDDFLNKYREWIRSTQLNTVTGLDSFEYACYSNGTTESFDKFYMRHPGKRFRCYRGDYMYHKLAWRNSHLWAWLDDAPLAANDAVVISLPFADTGDTHQQYHALMRECIQLGVPVIVDCAYFGACQGVDFDLSYSCITDVTFSLSKTFPVAHARIGIRFTRSDDDDTMFMYQKINYNNKIGAELGSRYLDRFSPDYIPGKYSAHQQQLCSALNVQASPTVLFGIGGEQWQQYNRGGASNRLSFHRQFIT